MSRHRDSIPPPISTESFNLRWHSIANQATPSVDIMSSPDPLNDNETSIVPPSSQRVTRSQRSVRYASPRKQTFELEVGDNQSPQRLLVTVETDDGDTTSGTRRRLFPSSSPFPSTRRGQAATTTIVPLKESIEEEPAADPMATPRRRGRPRKTNGTPIPSALKKRKAGTPLKQRTPRRQNTSHLPDPLSSDPVPQPTPTPKRRGRPPKNASVEPSSEVGSVLNTAKSRRGKRRRQAMVPEEIEDMAGEVIEPELVQEASAPLVDEDEMDLVGAPPPPAANTRTSPEARNAAVSSESPAREANSDIWMATLSQDATPRAQSRTSHPTKVASPDEASRRSPSADLASVASNADDYGAGAPSISDGSEADLPNDAALPRNNDTIAQGEDFSMIFMDSIQSFQAFKSSLNGPAPAPGLAEDEEDIGEETSLIINKTLESVRQRPQPGAGQTDAQEAIPEEMEQDEPFEGIAARDEEASVLEDQALEQVETLPTNSAELELNDERDVPDNAEEHLEEQPDEWEEEERQEDELPSAAQEVLGEEQDELASEEATPNESLLSSAKKFLSSRWLRSPRKADVSPLRQRLVQSQFRQADAGLSMAGEDVDADRASSPMTKSPLERRRSGRLDEPDYEDSFSEIPQDVLEAATPRRPGQQLVISEDEGDEAGPETIEEEASEDAIEEVQFVEEEEAVEEVAEEAEEAENQRQHESNVSQVSHQTAASNASSTAQTDNGRLPTPDDTPPNIEVQTEEDRDKSTVASLASSPPEPQAQLQSEQDAALHITEPSEAAARPSATSTKATPMNQMSSPAQAPHSVVVESIQRSAHDKASRPALSAIVRAGRALQTITSDPPSPEPRENYLRSPFRSSASKDSWSGSRDAQPGRRISLSPARRPVVHSHQRSASLDALNNEDVFTSTSRNGGQSSFMRALDRSINERASNSRESPQSSVASSMRINPPDEEMSWVAKEGPISPKLRGDNTLQDAMGIPTSGENAPLVSTAKAQELLLVEDEEQGDAEESNRGDDETDIWELEAERSHLQASTQQAPPTQATAHLHRRGQIPSPWRRSDHEKTVIDQQEMEEASHLDMRKSLHTERSTAGEPEEYSLLDQRQRDQELRSSQLADKGNLFDLSSFFSSPNAIPGRAMETSISKPVPAAAPVANEPIAARPASTFQTSSMFPSVAQKEFRPRRNSRSSLFSPAKSTAPAEQSEAGQSMSPETPDKLQMPTVAQKKNFTPRPRQTNQSFHASSAASASAAPTPPRMQLSHTDIQRWQQQTSNASQSSPEARRPLLRPLPPRNASPSKSSLRSPLKPHTPGRVVEFTSSVLSPAEQALVRQERRLSAGSGVLTQNETEAILEEGHDKENQDSDVSMTDASPEPQAQKQQPLSQTTWTRQHWLLLDNIIRHRREGEFQFDFPRRADKYLGKTVKGNGEAIVLERWHLECVDAFNDIVGGWNEGVLAKRVFSLIMAAERRQRRPQTGGRSRPGAIH